MATVILVGLAVIVLLAGAALARSKRAPAVQTPHFDQPHTEREVYAQLYGRPSGTMSVTPLAERTAQLGDGRGEDRPSADERRFHARRQPRERGAHRSS